MYVKNVIVGLWKSQKSGIWQIVQGSLVKRQVRIGCDPRRDLHRLASVAHQALKAALVGEIYLHVAPIILGWATACLSMPASLHSAQASRRAGHIGRVQHVRYGVVHSDS
jgi:hypothetical protein